MKNKLNIFHHNTCLFGEKTPVFGATMHRFSPDLPKAYWKEFYKRQNKDLTPSLFAQYVESTCAIPGQTLIELGCGSGSSTLYFARRVKQVYSVENDKKWEATHFIGPVPYTFDFSQTSFFKKIKRI